MVLDLNANTERSTIVCSHCVRRIAVMAGTMPEHDDPACC